MKNMKNEGFCNNCGKKGHLFHQCKMPITSVGIIAFRKCPKGSDYEYLMIRRKDTLGWSNWSWTCSDVGIAGIGR